MSSKVSSVHVLVVDDSAVVRQVLPALLRRDPVFEVTTAADPILARTRIQMRRPDVIVLDLEMPRMHGLTFLDQLMEEDDPIPVVVCSSRLGSGTDLAVSALERGAVDVIAKPQIDALDAANEQALALCDAVRAAAAAKRASRRKHCDVQLSSGRTASRLHELRGMPKLTADAVLAKKLRPARHGTGGRVIVIGASTGGTEALRVLFEALPRGMPPIVVVLHMPMGFTGAFARRLQISSPLVIKEAVSGDVLRRGQVLIAPGDRHLTLARRMHGYAVEVLEGPLVSRHRPSVDVLFRSAAQSAGAEAVGVILTGMGDDGASGLGEMRAAGAYTIAQDEASCVVFGMPREAIERGAVDQVLPLRGIVDVLGSLEAS